MIVRNRDELLQAMRQLLKEHDTRDTLQHNAYTYVTSKHDSGMQAIITAIEPTCQKVGLI